MSADLGPIPGSAGAPSASRRSRPSQAGEVPNAELQRAADLLDGDHPAQDAVGVDGHHGAELPQRL